MRTGPPDRSLLPTVTLCVIALLTCGVATPRTKPIADRGDRVGHPSTPSGTEARLSALRMQNTSAVPGDGVGRGIGRGVRMEVLSIAAVEGAEILAFDEATNRLFVTGAAGVSWIDISDTSSPRVVGTLTLDSLRSAVHDSACSVSHFAIDPIGRGFLAVTVIPHHSAVLQGAVAFVDPEEGVILGRITVGFHPDSCAFSQDGSTLVVANEGEPRIGVSGAFCDPPGSVSVIDLSGISGPEDLAELDAAAVDTVQYSGSALASALAPGPSPLRIHPVHRGAPVLDIEPEYVAVVGRTAFVTMQENNAVGAFDIPTRQWRTITPAGAVVRTVDASDKDGHPRIDDTVSALPMPDAIASFRSRGVHYLLTSDEGDDRGDYDRGNSPLADRVRLKDLAAAGRLDARAAASLDLGDARLGRLRVCAFSGDTDGDGDIDRPMMLGARSVSVWEASTLTRISDTGSQLEEWMLREAPELFNADSDSHPVPDARSDDRGPEPEGLVVAEIDGQPMAFVSLERPGAVAAVSLADPANPRVVGMTVIAGAGHLAPEGMAFIRADQRNPTGLPLLAVACEGSGEVVFLRVTAEPTAGERSGSVAARMSATP